MTISRKRYACGCTAMSADDSHACPACALKDLGIMPSDLAQLRKLCATFPDPTKDVGNCAFLAIRQLATIDGDSIAATPFGYAVYRNHVGPPILAKHRVERKKFKVAHSK